MRETELEREIRQQQANRAEITALRAEINRLEIGLESKQSLIEAMEENYQSKTNEIERRKEGYKEDQSIIGHLTRALNSAEEITREYKSWEGERSAEFYIGRIDQLLAMTEF